MGPAGDGWGRREPGPVVRPYAVTGGRTEPADGEMLELLALVVARPGPADTGDPAGLGPEHRAILGLCQEQATVADLASDTGLPLGVVRVLLADLAVAGRITVVPQRSADHPLSTALLQEVLHGLRAL